MFLIIDIETTGLDPFSDKIIEFACIHYDGNKAIDSYETLIHPGKKIPSHISQLTGIDNKTVADAPSFEQVSGEIFKRIQNNILVSHNSLFDMSFLVNAFANCHIKYKPKSLCTLKLSLKVISEKTSHRLIDLLQSFGIDMPIAHRAMNDAVGTFELFKMIEKSFAEKYPERKLIDESRESLYPRYVSYNKVKKFPTSPGKIHIFSRKKLIKEIVVKNAQKETFELLNKPLSDQEHVKLITEAYKLEFAEDFDWF